MDHTHIYTLATSQQKSTHNNNEKKPASPLQRNMPFFLIYPSPKNNRTTNDTTRHDTTRHDTTRHETKQKRASASDFLS